MKSSINKKEQNWNKEGHDNDRRCRNLLCKELPVRFQDVDYIVDVDADPEARLKDIDLVAIPKDKKITPLSVEVKADNFGKINGEKFIFCETISNTVKYENTRGEEGVGCIITSEADLFIFYFCQFNNYIKIKASDLREFIHNNYTRYNEKIARTWAPDNSTIWYYSVGLLIPVNDLLNTGIAKFYTSKNKLKDF